MTVEREKVLRSFTRTLTLDNPVIEIRWKTWMLECLCVRFSGQGSGFKQPQGSESPVEVGICRAEGAAGRQYAECGDEGSRRHVPAGLHRHSQRRDHGPPWQACPQCGRMSVAEDEGTLQVIGYRTPQPIRYFYADRPLSVGTWTTLEQILDEDWEAVPRITRACSSEVGTAFSVHP